MLFAATLACAACTATLGEPPGDGESSSTDGGLSPGLRRLTRVEYSHSIRDLLDVTVAKSDVPAEQLSRGHSQIASAQKVGYADIGGFYELGLTIAQTAAPRILEQTGCKDDACLSTFSEDFLPRAFRASTPSAVLDRYSDLLAQVDAGATLEERLTTWLATVLSSPYFLYRTENGASASGSLRELSDYEIASRLSYLVWQSGPDEALLERAAQEQLGDPATRESELDRMLSDDRARAGLRSFVLDWMGVFENSLPKKNVALLDQVPADFPRSAEIGLDLLIDDLLFSGQQATFTSLLVSDRVYADSSLAPAFGLVTDSTQHVALNVPPGERRGILTHPFVLGAHTKESGSSPFPIGKFIFENLFCETVPPPPPDIPAVADDDASGKTLRQRLEAVTSESSCSNCHQRIGPPGFAFLTYDAIGRYRESDGAGVPYDTSGTLVIGRDRTEIPFSDTVDMLTKLAETPAVADCIAKRFFRFAYGRFEGVSDGPEVEALSALSRETGADARALLRALVVSPQFSQVKIK